jgi:hypothetical protein
MANLNMSKTARLTEREIDRIVIAQADDETAWEDPIFVERNDQASFSIPAELASRAAFFARVHRTSGVDQWLMRIIQEHVDLEEAAFVGAKQEAAKLAAMR